MNINTKNPELLVLAIVLLVPLSYFTACSVISSARERGFDAVRLGDTKDQVIADLGDPSVIEQSGGIRFTRYAAKLCVSPCAERFWFENRLTLDLKAWSVEFDSSGKVIHKSYWVSP